MVYERGVNFVQVGEEEAEKIAGEKLDKVPTKEGAAKNEYQISRIRNFGHHDFTFQRANWH